MGDVKHLAPSKLLTLTHREGVSRYVVYSAEFAFNRFLSFVTSAMENAMTEATSPSTVAS